MCVSLLPVCESGEGITDLCVGMSRAPETWVKVCGESHRPVCKSVDLCVCMYRASETCVYVLEESQISGEGVTNSCVEQTVERVIVGLYV